MLTRKIGGMRSPYAKIFVAKRKVLGAGKFFFFANYQNCRANKIS